MGKVGARLADLFLQTTKHTGPERELGGNRGGRKGLGMVEEGSARGKEITNRVENRERIGFS